MVSSGPTRRINKAALIGRKRVPPGQRLLRYGFLSALIVSLQAASLPIGTPKVLDVSNVCAQNIAPPINLTTSLDDLKQKLEQASALKDLRAGVFVQDPASGRYVDMNGRDSFPAASMIKVPVFVSLLIAQDEGRVNPDQLLEIRPDLIAGGSGWLQWRPANSKITVRDTAELMITISDNTATNMLIDLLGGKEALSQQFLSWGLNQTKINNMLGDFQGTNTTSPYDLVYLLARIDRGELVKPETKLYMNKVMERTRIRTLLPPGLGPGAKIAHKTGDIGCMVGDVGMVTTSDGRKYIVSVQVQRPYNDRRANLLIRGLSKMIYQVFSTDTTDCSQVQVASLSSLMGPPLRVHAFHTRTGSRHHRRHHRG